MSTNYVNAYIKLINYETFQGPYMSNKNTTKENFGAFSLYGSVRPPYDRTKPVYSEEKVPGVN